MHALFIFALVGMCNCDHKCRITRAIFWTVRRDTHISSPIICFYFFVFFFLLQFFSHGKIYQGLSSSTQRVLILLTFPNIIADLQLWAFNQCVKSTSALIFGHNYNLVPNRGALNRTVNLSLRKLKSVSSMITSTHLT